MGIDANATIEVLDPPQMYRCPWHWAKVDLRRDYALFDLLAGGRSGDPSDAVFPPESPYSACLELSQLDAVASVYRDRTGTSSTDLDAITAAVRVLTTVHRVRVVFSFF